MFSTYPASPASNVRSPIGTRPPLNRTRGWRWMGCGC